MIFYMSNHGTLSCPLELIFSGPKPSISGPDPSHWLNLVKRCRFHQSRASGMPLVSKSNFLVQSPDRDTKLWFCVAGGEGMPLPTCDAKPEVRTMQIVHLQNNGFLLHVERGVPLLFATENHGFMSQTGMTTPPPKDEI